MSKMTNHWEIPTSTVIPYLQWGELANGQINGWEIGRHNHASYELHIILSGQCSLFMGSTELTLQAGQGILIAPEVFPFAVFPHPSFRMKRNFFSCSRDRARFCCFPWMTL